MADHHIQFSLQADNFGRVDAEVVCFANEDALCRTVCLRSECEEGCLSDYLPVPHPRERVDYCNVKTWLEHDDDGVIGCYSGEPTAPRTGAIRPVWEGDSYSWRYLRGAGSKEVSRGNA